MTDPTDDQVKALLDEMTFAMFGDGTDDTISEKLARALLASEAARKLAEERLAKALVAREKIKAAYEELLATVHGECPSLINEDSGGSQVLLDLILAADEAITTIKELNE